MSGSNAKGRYQTEYNKRNYYTSRIYLPKGRESAVKEYCEIFNISLNGLVNRLLMKELGMTEEEWNRKE